MSKQILWGTVLIIMCHISFAFNNAHARYSYEETIAWMVFQSDLIVRGQLAGVKKISEKENSNVYEALINIHEDLSGEYQGNQIAIAWEVGKRYPPLEKN